jgi:hypothetical protein
MMFMLVPASKKWCLPRCPANMYIIQLPFTGHTSCLILYDFRCKDAIVKDFVPDVERVGCEEVVGVDVAIMNESSYKQRVVANTDERIWLWTTGLDFILSLAHMP